jgi:hypothetical protein
MQSMNASDEVLWETCRKLHLHLVPDDEPNSSPGPGAVIVNDGDTGTHEGHHENTWTAPDHSSKTA